MKKLLIIGVLLVLILPSHTASAHDEPLLRISPVSSRHTAQPGSTVRATITVQNPTNQLVQARVSAKDFEASPALDGQPAILEAGDPKYGLANWLADANLDKTLTIPANQKIDYEAMFRVPDNAEERTYYGTVLFSGASDSDLAHSVGSLVFITVGHPDTKLAINKLEFGESDDATKKFGVFTATVENQSDGLSTPKLRLKITDSTGKVILETDQDGEGSVLPSSRRNYTFTPPAELPNEPLTVTVTAVDQNGATADKSIQINESFQVQATKRNNAATKKSFPWLLVVGGLSLLAGVIAMVVVIRKRQAKSKIPDLTSKADKLTTPDPTADKTPEDSP